MSVRRNPEGPYWTAVRAAERSILDAALRQTKGDVKRAAAALGLSRNWFVIRSRQLGLDMATYRRGRNVGGPPLTVARPAASTSSWLTAAIEDK
jgi:hypothetical protein